MLHSFNKACRWPGRAPGRFLLGLCICGSALAQEQVWQPSGETQCALVGWSIDIDPKGANVRATPSVKAPVVGTLPAYVMTGGGLSGGVGIDFEIIGSHNGWLKITDAKDDPSHTELPPRATYAGTGWIAGNLVRFAVQSGRGYAKPDAASKQLFDFGDDWLTDFAVIQRVVACQGKWALLDFRQSYRRDAKNALIALPVAEQRRGRAWFRQICGIQETTCDSLVDPPSAAPPSR